MAITRNVTSHWLASVSYLARLYTNHSLKLTIQHLDFYQYSSLIDKLACLASLMGVRCATSKICVVLLHWLLALYVRPYFNHVFFCIMYNKWTYHFLYTRLYKILKELCDRETFNDKVHLFFLTPLKCRGQFT